MLRKILPCRNRLKYIFNHKQYLAMDAIEKAVGQYAADTFIESMTLNSRLIVRFRYILVVIIA